MEWLESLGLLGLFLGSALAASIVPFSSDVLYVAILATTGQDLGCFLAATSGSWLGSLFSWFPIVGDLTVLALGFYKAPRGWTFLLLFIGKAIRYLFWNVVVGLF